MRMQLAQRTEQCLLLLTPVQRRQDREGGHVAARATHSADMAAEPPAGRTPEALRPRPAPRFAPPRQTVRAPGRAAPNSRRHQLATRHVGLLPVTLLTTCQCRWVVCEPLGHCPEGRSIHVHRVKRVRDRQPRHLAPLGLKTTSALRHRRPGDHRLLGRIEARDIKLSAQQPRRARHAPPEPLLPTPPATPSGRPRSTSSCMSRPRAHTERRRILERQHLGHVRTHKLANRVAYHDLRARPSPATGETAPRPSQTAPAG